jgi:hypothetical protein
MVEHLLHQTIKMGIIRVKKTLLSLPNATQPTEPTLFTTLHVVIVLNRDAYV